MRLQNNVLFLYLYPLLVSGDLGSYSGQYGVGTIDLEVPAQSPTNITDTTLKNGTYAFRLDTVYFSLFYPIAPGTTSTKAQHPWLAPPKNLIAQGLSQAIGGSVPASLIQIGFDAFAANLSIPAQVDVPLLSGTNKLPIMTFSHGDPTMSQWYSQFYGELASRGIVVAAVTHRDGSSPATMVLFKNGTSYDIIAFTEAQVLPSMNSTDFHLRQLEMRQAELTETVRVLSNIVNGNGSSVFNANSRGEGQNLSDWKNRLDLGNIIIAGQSFGGNSVFRYLAEPNPLLPAGAAAPYDPGKDSGPFATTNVKVPLLIPDSEEWSAVPTDFYGQQHFDVVKSVAQGALNATGAGWFMTLLGTVHTSITDVGLIAESFANFFTNETQLLTLDAKAAVLQFANVTVDFASYIQNRSASNIRGILADGVTYPTFQLFPNASVLQNPWEVHVAPNVSKNSTAKKSSAYGLESPLRGISSITLLATLALLALSIL